MQESMSLKYECGSQAYIANPMGALNKQLASLTRRFDHPLFLITPPYIAQCMGACIAKGS